jgi:hypothetical protein
MVGERPGGVGKCTQRSGSGQQETCARDRRDPVRSEDEDERARADARLIGSRPRTAVATRTAVASNTEASTPTARRRIQLRRIWRSSKAGRSRPCGCADCGREGR